MVVVPAVFGCASDGVSAGCRSVPAALATVRGTRAIDAVGGPSACDAGPKKKRQRGTSSPPPPPNQNKSFLLRRRRGREHLLPCLLPSPNTRAGWTYQALREIRRRRRRPRLRRPRSGPFGAAAIPRTACLATRWSWYCWRSLAHARWHGGPAPAVAQTVLAAKTRGRWARTCARWAEARSAAAESSETRTRRSARWWAGGRARAAGATGSS